MHSYFGFGVDNHHYCYHRYIYYNCVYKKYYNYLCKLNDITTMFVLGGKTYTENILYLTRMFGWIGKYGQIEINFSLRERERESVWQIC